MEASYLPVATYRLQFNAGFTLAQATRLLPYLHTLGISTVYASPLFKARRGSEHGYSVTNPLELNPELGGRAAFDNFCRKLQAWKLGLLLDIVPNHMALSNDNFWWQDVLEHGPSSLYSDFFDINWEPPCRLLTQKLLLPVLGRPYGDCLENQELVLVLTPEGLGVTYYQHYFPLDPATYPLFLTHRLEELRQQLGEEHPDLIRLLGILTLIQHLPPRQTTNRKKRRERHHWSSIIKKSLWLLYENSPPFRTFVQNNLRRFNGERGNQASFDLLDRLLRQQVYRLAHWLVSLEMINYRRFFSINDLIGIRVEDPEVFAATHHLLFRLVEEGKIQGLRLDHIDGLYDPLEYLRRLQEQLRLRAPDATAPFYLVVEKILAPQEELPEDWPVAGTTGYDFLNCLNNFFIDPAGLRRLESAYHQWCPELPDWETVVYEKKKLVFSRLFGGEIRNLSEMLLRLAAQDRRAMDLPAAALEAALVELTACLGIYRTYVTGLQVSSRDRGWLLQALATARRRQPALHPPALEFLGRILLLDWPASLEEETKKAWLHFVRCWQQCSGPVMAKGLEDTACYVYNPLLSLNEVGGYRQPTTVAAFHASNQQRRQRWPGTLNATSTHDTKRSEDVRARLNVLTELAGEWQACLRRWTGWNRYRKIQVAGREAPDRNEELFLYQTLVGAWPLEPGEVPAFQERLRQYLIKALREAKVNSRWIDPQEDYETAVLRFADRLLQPDPDNPFLPDFLAFQEKVAFYGALNSLSQVLLKIGAPGVPDFYQGQELWDFSLVDPDNRRPVDFARRQRLLAALQQQEKEGTGLLWSSLWPRWRDGSLKLYLTYKALQARRKWQQLFAAGEYLPLAVTGRQRRRVIAWAWRKERQWLLVLGTRFFTALTPPGQPPLSHRWAGTAVVLPDAAPKQWREELSDLALTAHRRDRRLLLPLAEVFQYLPLALLSGQT